MVTSQKWVEFRIWSINDLFVFVFEAMSMGVPGVKVRQGEGENVDPFINMESFKSSARELLCRIDQLEKRPAKVRYAFTHMATVEAACSEGTHYLCLCPSLGG